MIIEFIERRKVMRFLLITILAALIPTMAFANDHTTPGAGYGTAVTVGSKKMEGTSGVLMHQTTNDVWIWEKPLKGFPKATSATCDQFFAFASGQQQPIGGTFTCQSVDGDGDGLISTGVFQPDGTALITQIAGTGKWAQHVGSQFIGKTDIQADTSTSVYSWTPKK